jgi:hypothetical protein
MSEVLAVSEDEAAKMIGIESASLAKDRMQGHLGIPYIKAGRRVLYSVEDLKSWVTTNRQTPIQKENNVGAT